MIERKYNYSLGELFDLLTIKQLKEVKIPEHKEEYSEEISDIIHDINLVMGQQREYIHAEWLRDLVVLAEFNTHIWYNEADIRDKIKEMTNDKEPTAEEYIDIAKRLILTHSINGIRNTAKNRINKVVGGRLDYKVDSLSADAEKWRPSGY
jgi:hypothetical protein